MRFGSIQLRYWGLVILTLRPIVKPSLMNRTGESSKPCMMAMSILERECISNRYITKPKSIGLADGNYGGDGGATAAGRNGGRTGGGTAGGGRKRLRRLL